MKSLGRRVALTGLGATLAGCAPEQKAVTQSNAAGVSGQKLKRVLIGIRVSSPLMTEIQNAALLQPAELKQAFEAKWPPLGIAVEVVDVDGAENGGLPRLSAANARFQGDQLLLLQTGPIKSSRASVREYEIDATLYDGAARKVIWRASTELPDFWRVGYTSSGRPGAAERYVDSLTAKLREDGLI